MSRRFWSAGLVALFLMATACADGAARAYRAGLERWDDGQYSEAIVLLRAITRDYPESPYAPQALLKVAQVQAYDLRLYDEAEDTFQLYLKLYPHSKDTRRALEDLTTLLFEKKHDYLRAINECHRYIDSFPTSPQLPLMQRRIVYSYLQLREFNQARVEAGLFLRRFPQDEGADEVAYEIIRSHFIQGEEEKAISEARKSLIERPKSTYRARTEFILAAALEDADRLPEALEAYKAARVGHPEPQIVDRKMSSVADRLARKHK